MKIKIHVLKKDIQKGKQATLSRCPIALAIRRQFPGKTIAVGYGFVLIGHKVFELPPKAKKFLSKFDNSKAVKPFNFFINKLICN